MTDQGDTRRAAAICVHCGSCHVVRIEPDGTVRVIGTNGSCACGESDYRVLGPEHPTGTDTDATLGEQRGT